MPRRPFGVRVEFVDEGVRSAVCDGCGIILPAEDIEPITYPQYCEPCLSDILLADII